MRATQAEKAERFQALHARSGAFVIPNPWDAGTARILTSLGFEALTTTSAGLAFVLGRRDGAGRVSRDEWEAVCRQMETEFRAGRFGDAVIAGVRATGALMARHFPPRAGDRNELPDAPVVS